MRLIGAASTIFVLAFTFAVARSGPSAQQAPLRPPAEQNLAGPRDGQQIFRFDTFCDEQLWTDVLQMQHAITNHVDIIVMAAMLVRWFHRTHFMYLSLRAQVLTRRCSI